MECVLFLTSDCNMRCKYCYEGGDKKKNKLSMDMMYRAIDFCEKTADGNEIDLTLLGGEPLLNRSVFIELMDYIRSKDIKVSMTTNGTIWDDEILNRIKEKEVDLYISTDGNESTHNMNRLSVSGDNLYKKTMDTIGSLMKNEIPFGIRMTIAQNTVSSFFDNVVYFYDMGIKHINIAMNEFEKWEDNNLIELDKQISKLDMFYIENIDNGLSINLYEGRMGEMIMYRKRRFCSAGTKYHFVINCDGNIYPCSYVVDDSEWKIGNIFSGIDSNIFLEKTKKYFLKEKACADCENYYCCVSTRCGFKNYRLSGWLNKANQDLCKLETICIKHNKIVFSALTESKNPRLMKAYKYIEENGYKIRPIVL